uniref:Uncharacterized protein n=1 Tax=Ditylenchus dipsaci TaxID=166011 RepID=A0A915E357_9BILA
MCAMFARILPIDQYYLSASAHVVTCSAQTVQRKVVTKQSSLLEVNRNLRPEVQMYFRSARDLSGSAAKHVNERTSKAVKFAGAAKAQIEKMVERQKRCRLRDPGDQRAGEASGANSSLRDSSYVLDNSCTLDKTIPGQDLFLNPNDVSGISSKMSSRGSNISSSYAQHASALSNNSSQLSLKSSSFNRHYGTPSSNHRLVCRVLRRFSTSYDGKFKVPKLVPLNSPRAFSNGSGSHLLASYNSKPHLSHTSSSASSNNSAARSVMMAGRIKKGSVISKKLN